MASPPDETDLKILKEENQIREEQLNAFIRSIPLMSSGSVRLVVIFGLFSS